MKHKQSGFTLVEIAIVLVIVGLILGGVLKGQEMISNAKVRNVVDQTTAIQTAVYAFQDRFRSLPGDYAQASTNISGAPGNGDGDGLVNADGDRGLLWLHLSAAGYIAGNFDGQAVVNNLKCPATTCPRNTFGGPMMFSWGSARTGTKSRGHELRMGRSTPVGVLAEIDRKVDDSIPETGSLQTDNQNLKTCRTGSNDKSSYNVTNEQEDCAGVRVM